MAPAQKTKLDGIDTGAEVNWDEPADDGNLYARTRAAGSSSGAWQQVASNPITAVTGGSGIDVTGTSNRTVAIDYGQGVEADGDDQLTVKLDGTTLTKSDNGLRVNATYKPGSADQADQLSTARTLLGQSFDGTANVSGDMTTVGNITFSGAQTISTNGNNDLTINTGTADATFSGDVVIQAGGAIQLNNTANDASVRHVAAGALASNVVYTWPAAPGENRVLQSADTGVLTWVLPSDLSHWSRVGTRLEPKTGGDSLTVKNDDQAVFTVGENVDGSGEDHLGIYYGRLRRGQIALTSSCQTEICGSVLMATQPVELVLSGSVQPFGQNAATGTAQITPSDGNIVTSGNLTAAQGIINGNVQIRSNNELQLFNSDNTFSVRHEAQAGLSTNATYVWPALPAANRVLQSDSTGSLTWVENQGGGGGGGGTINYNGAAALASTMAMELKVLPT